MENIIQQIMHKLYWFMNIPQNKNFKIKNRSKILYALYIQAVLD